MAAKAKEDGPQVWRLLALAAIYNGSTRGETAQIGEVTLPAAIASCFGEIVRDWMVKFNTHGPDELASVEPPRGFGRD